ncbi:MAG: hypothetical protein ACI8QG_001915 [Flavobacteriales bacterium]|jgi:hypothetical protein
MVLIHFLSNEPDVDVTPSFDALDEITCIRLRAIKAFLGIILKA